MGNDVPKSPYAAIAGWASEHPGLDVVLAALTVSAHVVLISRIKTADIMYSIPVDQRVTTYATGGQVIATLGGLAAIAVTIYQTASGNRALATRRHFSGELRRNWSSLLFAAAIPPLICVICMIFDRVNDLYSVRFVFEGILIFSFLRFFRLIWLFSRLLTVADMDSTDVVRAPAPALDPRWQGFRDRRSTGTRG